MAVELADAYVSLIPSLRGGTQEITRQVAPAAATAGAEAGKQAGGRFTRAFSGILAGAAIFGGGAFLKESFTRALDRAALPAQMQAEFGLTAGVARDAAKTASTLYAQGWGQSLTQVGDAAAAATRTLKAVGTGENLQHVTRQAQALADTFGEEVNPLVVAAGQLVKTGLAPDMETAFDQITRGFQNGADSGQDFLDTITEYSGQFDKLGLDGSAAIGLINQALADGARNSDFVADALKEFSIRAVDGSELTAEGFAMAGLSAENMAAKIGQGGNTARKAFAQTLDALRAIPDPVERSQAAVALFGTKAEDLGESLYALDPATVAATGGMDNVAGAAQQLTDTVGGEAKASVTSLARTFSGALGNALTFVVPLLQGLFGMLEPLLPILGPMAVALGAVTAAQWAWNAALNANPLVLIVTLIGGLIAALIALWQRSEAFRGIVVGVWRAVGNVVKAVVGAVVQAWNWAGRQLDAFASWVGRVMGSVGRWFSGAADTARRVWVGVINWFRGVPDKIAGFFSGIGDAIGGAFKGALNWIIDVINGVIGGFNTVIKGLNYVPGVDIGLIGKIPRLAEGGIVTGPTLALVGEGRQDEAIIPLDQLDSMLSDPRGGDRGPVDVVLRVEGGDSDLVRLLTKWIRTKGGGDVQRALGQGAPA